MTEIAEAVLTLRTDDTALEDGLRDAEKRTRDALQRIEAAVGRASLGVDAAAVDAVANATFALDELRGGIAALGTVSPPTRVRLKDAAGALEALGAGGLTAAGRLRSAVALLSGLATNLAAQAAAVREAAGAAPAAPAPPAHIPTLARRARVVRAAGEAARARPGGIDGAPLVGALHVTVERENPRAIQAGVERALSELATRAELAGALD